MFASDDGFFDAFGVRYKATTAILALAAGTAIATSAVPASAQSAPPTFEACTYNGNGIASTISPRSCAQAGAGGSAPYGQYSQNYGSIANGRPSTFTDGAATTSYSDGGWTNTATATSNTGGVASSTADLRHGSLHAYVSNGSSYFHGGGANTRISDVFTFNNTSGSDVVLKMGYSFDGRFTGTFDNYTDGSIGLGFGDPNTYYGRVLFANSHDYANDFARSSFDAVSGTLDQRVDNGHNSDVTFTGSFDRATGYVQGAFATALLIPTGQSTFGFVMTLNLDCRGTGATCDFGHTSTFGFGGLPDGLSYTSQSGVFGVPLTGSVPEAAVWAMMIVGFGMVGSASRRRQKVHVTFA